MTHLVSWEEVMLSHKGLREVENMSLQWQEELRRSQSNGVLLIFFKLPTVSLLALTTLSSTLYFHCPQTQEVFFSLRLPSFWLSQPLRLSPCFLSRHWLITIPISHFSLVHSTGKVLQSLLCFANLGSMAIVYIQCVSPRAAEVLTKILS